MINVVVAGGTTLVAPQGASWNICEFRAFAGTLQTRRCLKACAAAGAACGRSMRTKGVSSILW